MGDVEPSTFESRHIYHVDDTITYVIAMVEECSHYVAWATISIALV